jgi:hypothetical protein
MMIMTQLHKEWINVFVNQEEVMASLVPHIDEMKGNVKEMKDDLELFKDMRWIQYVITCAGFSRLVSA